MSFIGLRTALSGLEAARAGMDTNAHNIANVNTPGYTRQRLLQQARAAMLGTDVVKVDRLRENLADIRSRDALERLEFSDRRYDLLILTEDAVADLDTGISAQLDTLWGIFDDLSMDPNDQALRQTALAQLGLATDKITSAFGEWDNIADRVYDELRGQVDEVNALLEKVQSVNESIRTAGGVPNDLADQRDILADELAGIIGAESRVASDGTLTVLVGGRTVVDGTVRLPVSLDASGQVLANNGDVINAGGRVGATVSFLTVDLPGYGAELDTFAQEFADAINNIHASGWVDSTTPGGPLVAYNPAAPAQSLTVAISDPADLALSDDPGPPYPTHNGNIAAQLAGLDATVVTASNETLAGAWRSLVTGLGADASAAATAADAHDQILAAAEMSRQGAHGVSIDEEMTQLVSLQHAYSAAARVMTTLDQALDTLINRTGLVGR